MKPKLKDLIKDRATAHKAFTAMRGEYNKLVAIAEPTAEQTARMEALDTEMDPLEATVVELDAKIAREQREARRDALMNATSSITIAGDRARFTSFEPNPETTGGFKSLAHFATTIRSQVTREGMVELAAAPATYLQNSGSAGEGWAVPPEFLKDIWDIAFNVNAAMRYFRPNPTSSNTVILAKDETTPWGAAGVQAYWRAEAATLTPSKLQLLGSEIKLNEIYAFCAATNEVLSDAPMLQDRLTNKAGLALGYKIFDAMVNGDGAGKPLGFMNAPCNISQAAESSQATATIVVNNLTKMRTRMMPDSLARSVWLANQEIEPQLVNLQIGSMPVFTMLGNGISQSPGLGLLGKPLEYIWQASTVGTVGDIMLVDPEGYYLATKEGGGVDFASSIHLYFDVNMTAFRWVTRVGGQPILSKPVTPPTGRGTLTKSHFVSLATRP